MKWFVALLLAILIGVFLLMESDYVQGHQKGNTYTLEGHDFELPQNEQPCTEEESDYVGGDEPEYQSMMIDNQTEIGAIHMMAGEGDEFVGKYTWLAFDTPAAITTYLLDMDAYPVWIAWVNSEGERDSLRFSDLLEYFKALIEPITPPADSAWLERSKEDLRILKELSDKVIMPSEKEER